MQVVALDFESSDLLLEVLPLGFELVRLVLQFVGVVEAAFATPRGGLLVALPAELPALFFLRGGVVGGFGGAAAAHVASLGLRQAGAAATVAAG